MNMKDIVQFCGYTSAYSLLSDHMTTAELTDLLESLVDSPEDAVDFVFLEVVRIAEDIFEWVDRDALIAQAEDMAYAKYRDGE